MTTTPEALRWILRRRAFACHSPVSKHFAPNDLTMLLLLVWMTKEEFHVVRYQSPNVAKSSHRACAVEYKGEVSCPYATSWDTVGAWLALLPR
jgi:hypothetical protein